MRDDFCEFFIGLAGGAGGGTKGAAGPLTVSLEGFREYFRDVGVCEPYDTVFVPMIEVGGGQKVETADATRGASRRGIFSIVVWMWGRRHRAVRDITSVVWILGAGRART